MKLNKETTVSTDLKTILGIVAAVAMGVFAYTEVTARLTSLETSRELFQADLLKNQNKNQQTMNSLCLLKIYIKL